MKRYTIYPKEYYGEKYIQLYLDYTKKEALKLYREKFPQFTRKELLIE